MNHSEYGFISLDIKSYIEYQKEFKYRTSFETTNPISIKERVENLILPRVMMEVFISKVNALLTRACMIYLSKAAQYLKTWMTVHM